LPDLARRHSRVSEHAHAQCNVDPFPDQVDIAVIKDGFDLEVRMSGEKPGKVPNDEWGPPQFVDLFHAIGSDRDNRVVILTGSGEAFMESITPEGFDFFSPQGYDKIYREGKKVLMNILDIEAPMIAAVNGPVRVHSEYILLADIVTGDAINGFSGQAAFRIRHRPR
jgi:hypothetical protein